MAIIWWFYYNELTLRTEFYIAKRLSSRKEGAKAGIMERIATIATALSVAVVIVTLSVVVGFKRDLERLISGAVADVVVTAPQSRGVVSGVGLERYQPLEEMLCSEEVRHISPFTTKEGVLKNDDNIVGVLLKGVDTLYDQRFYQSNITEGSFPRIGLEPRSKDILLSERVARKMDVEVGDRIEMLFVDHDGGVLRDRFQISGLYSTGVDFLDEGYAFTDMRNVARLYDGDNDVVTGYEIWLREGVDKQGFLMAKNEALMELYFECGLEAEAFAIEDIFAHIFGWLATHDVTATAVVVIMLIVALLNMATALLIIVLERERMIGQLRAMGMRRRGVIEVFLFRALFIICRGVAWGAAIGIAIATVQHLWHVLPLPSEGYLLDAVPAAMCWGWWLVAVVGSIASILLFMLLPAAVTARVSPAETMRYE